MWNQHEQQPHLLAENVIETRAQRGRGEERFPTGVKVEVKKPTGQAMKGVVVGCRTHSAYGVIVKVQLSSGEIWEGTAERVRRI